MTQTNVNPLSSLPAAEAQLVGAINAAAATLDGLATSAVAAALSRLEASADGVKTRIGAALLRMNALAAGVVASLEGAANGILEDLSTEEHLDRLGTAHREALVPALIDPTPAQTGESCLCGSSLPARSAADGVGCPECGADVIDLSEPAPALQTTGIPVIDADGVKRLGPDDTSEVIDLAPIPAEASAAAVMTTATEPAAQDLRQDAQPAETTVAPSADEIAPPAQSQAFPTAADLHSLATMPEVARITSCIHRGIGVPACDDCMARAEQLQATTAANPPVEPAKAPPVRPTPKPRGRRRPRS